MNVPILRYFGYPIAKCIGSAAAIGFFISLFGAIGFLISGFYFDANLPFGGYKMSGMGKEHGRNAIELFTEEKAVCIAY